MHVALSFLWYIPERQPLYTNYPGNDKRHAMPMLKIDAAAIALHGLSGEGSWAARLVAWVHGAGSRRTDLAAQAAGALWPVRIVWAWPLAGSHAWAHRAVLTVCCSGARGHGSIGVAGFNGPGRQASPGYNTLL